MSVTTRCAIRGTFLDISHPVTTAGELPDAVRSLEDGVLLLEGGRIVALEPWEAGQRWIDAATPLHDLRGKLIVPGFIDCHLHYPQTEMIGAFGEQLLSWLEHYTFPTERQFTCPEYAAAIATIFLDQLLQNGTTSALVFGTVHPQSVDALFSAAEARQMRLIAGKVMMDRHAPDYLLETPEESERQTRALIQRWHGRGRLNYALTPRFAPTSSPALLEKVRQLRAEFPDVWVHTHLSENPEEVAWVRELFPERQGYLDVYHHYGLTGRRSVFAHAIHLEEPEWRCLHDSDSAIAFCPTSNLFLGSGLFNLGKRWAHGVKMGVGTDVGAGTTFNMLQTLGEAYKVGQLQQYRLSACEALYHATLGAAEALDLHDRIGNFAPGKEADFVVLEPAASPLQVLRLQRCHSALDKLFVLMTVGDDRNIAQTWVNGQCAWSREQKEAAA
ncbi:guanine deaminase [Pantoea sp. 1.19]|uniref:guanine deaminase n=1 Tax=Pantoea sp. 1.19 TaxID=1925589 RepID=UPI000948EFCF|nr:guanine deaminase [Pantoea sp. 1.19]